MSFNPHSVHSIATANDCGLKGWDLRTLRYPLFSILIKINQEIDKLYKQ